MEWNRSETIALAKHSCTLCHGIGLRPSWGQSVAPCNCVLRAIFRACYVRFRDCSDKQQCITQVNLEYVTGSSGGPAVTYDRKHEEYAADFILIAKRTLSEDEYRLFKFHYLLGADWKLCCARLKLDRGRFFHSAYRIQQKLGRAFRETEPYGIFPVYAYFEEERREPQPLGIRTGTGREKPSRKVPRIVSRIERGNAQPPGSVRPEGGGGRRVA